MTRTIRVFLFSLILAHCAESRSVIPVTNKDEALQWFNQNQSTLEYILGELLASPRIKWIEKMRMELLPKYGEFSESDIAKFEALLEESQEIGIISISVAREENSMDSELISVTLVLISEGLMTNGYSLAIAYIPDPNFVLRSEDYGIEYEALNLENWYLSELFHD